MYTLRTFTDASKTKRLQINLGESYQVEGVTGKDYEDGMKLRVYGNSSISSDGIAVYSNQHAFIMTESGKTFETLNRPPIN